MCAHSAQCAFLQAMAVKPVSMVKQSSSSAEERWSSEQEQGDPSPAAESEEDQLFCSCKAVREQGDGGRSQLVVGLLGWSLPEPRNSVQEQSDPNPAQLVS